MALRRFRKIASCLDTFLKPSKGCGHQFVSRFATGTGASGLHHEENRKSRVELAAAYRILDRMGLNEGVCNHLSLMAPAQDGSGRSVMLLVPYGLHWKAVTASSLLGISDEGKVVEGDGDPEISAFHIHRGVRSIHNQKCIMHIHAPYSTALGCLKDPTIKLCHQTALRFHKRIGYDTEFGGFGDNKVEGCRLAETLGDKEILVMGNHGILAAEPRVADGVDALYYFERLAMFQLLAMSTGRELSLISEEIYETTKSYLNVYPRYAKAHFDAHVSILKKECPEFAD